jgi:hypothetical protein
MKKLKKLPIFLALIVTIFASACTEIEVDPRGHGDDDTSPIVLPPPTKSQTASDTTSIG